MQRYLVIATAIALAAGPAWAQMSSQTTTQTTGQTTGQTMGQSTGAPTNNVGNPAIKDSTPHTMTSATKGRNSFTEKQARRRLAKAGYMVTSLTKDADGVWTGAATKSGKTVNVGLDFKGNISER